MFSGKHNFLRSRGGTDKGERIFDALLIEMNSFGKDDSSLSLQLRKNNVNVPPTVILLVLAATNRPYYFNLVLLRPGVHEAVLLVVKEWCEITNIDDNKRMEN